MTSWEWVEENPVMSEAQFARFCRMQQMAGAVRARAAIAKAKGDA